MRLLLPLLVLTAAGCLCGPTTGLPDAGLPAGSCFNDADCPGAPLTFCNTTTSQCTPTCATNADCTAAVRKELAIAACDSAQLGCTCDHSTCVPALCARDSDCSAEQACRDGACVAAPDAASVAGCAVVPDHVVLREGASVAFSVLAWDAQKQPVVPKAPPTWAPLGATLTHAGATFTAVAPNAAATAAVQATVGTKTCTAKVHVLTSTPPAADALVVLVTDELTGRPLANATVLVSEPATGTPRAPTADTSALGLASFSNLAGPVAVSVFHPAYGYLTVAHYDLSGSRVLALPLRRNPLDRFGGYRGTLKDVPATSNFHLALTGTSVPGLAHDLALTDLGFASLVGRNVTTRFKIGSSFDDLVPLPTGLFVRFTDQRIKEEVSSLGAAGLCLDAAGMPDEAAIAAGDCGTRAAWAFTGDLPLGDIPIAQFARGFQSVNFLTFLQRISPTFWKFQSSVVRDVPFTLRATPTTPDGGFHLNEADGGTAGFTTVDHSYSVASVPLAFETTVQLPALPSIRGVSSDTTLLFSGAFAPGRGFVPLGIGATGNSLRSAPPHHGLEGAPFGVVAFALRTASDASIGLASSALVRRLDPSALKFDPTGATPVDLRNTEFPPLVDSGKYDPLTRVFGFTSAPPLDPIVSLTRVVFTDDAAHTWSVWLDPAKHADGFHLPTPPGTFADRTFGNGMTTGARSPFFVQQIRFASTGFAGTVELSAAYADRLNDLTTGFSLVDHPRPSVAWLIPSAPNPNVPKGSAVVVRVRGFQVGTEGFVRLRFSPQTAGCPDVDGTMDPSNGKGEIVLTVPSTCVLPNAQLTATLMTNGGVEVMPVVSSVLNANVVQ